MPIVYDAPITNTVIVNASRPRTFCVNMITKCIDIQYEDGDRQIISVTNPEGKIIDVEQFVPTGAVQEIQMGPDEYNDIVTTNPTLYATLKQLINGRILQAKSRTGTIV